MVLGLGLAEWLTIAALVGALVLTFRVMTRAAPHYDKARRARGGEKQREAIRKDKDEARHSP